MSSSDICRFCQNATCYHNKMRGIYDTRHFMRLWIRHRFVILKHVKVRSSFIVMYIRKVATSSCTLILFVTSSAKRIVLTVWSVSAWRSFVFKTQWAENHLFTHSGYFKAPKQTSTVTVYTKYLLFLNCKYKTLKDHLLFQKKALQVLS